MINVLKMFALIILLSAGSWSPAANAPRPLNVVIILADDLGYGDVSCYGATLAKTPNIDRLASQGRRFTDAHTPSSVCTPTRYGLLTGRYCWRTSLRRETLPPLAPLLIEPTRLTLASLFKHHGYTTAAIGKWHLGYGNRPKADFDKPLTPGPNDLGFDYHFGVPQNHGDFLRCYVENDHIIGRKEGEPFVALGPGKLPTGLAEMRQDDRTDQVLTEKAIAWLDQVHDKPFLLYFAPVAVHAPIAPNKKFRRSSKCGLYGDYIQELDDCVGRVLAVLERHDLVDNTLVIFTSDNGAVSLSTPMGKEVELILEDDTNEEVSGHCKTAWMDALAAGHKANGNLRMRKASIYEGGSRVPFIARWPGQISPGTSCDEMICLTDLMATFAGIIGDKLPSNAGEDSYDILPALRGEKQTAPIREALVIQNVEGVTAIRQGPWKYVAVGHAPDSPKKNSPMTREGDKAQLYNLADDVQETKDVIEQHPDVAERLLKLLQMYREQGYSRKMP